MKLKDLSLNDDDLKTHYVIRGSARTLALMDGDKDGKKLVVPTGQSLRMFVGEDQDATEKLSNARVWDKRSEAKDACDARTGTWEVVDLETAIIENLT